MTVLPLLALFVAALVPIHGGVFASTVPAFLWSSHYNLVSDNGLKESVNYQVISPKDLAKSVSSEAGWSNFLCKGNKFQEPLDLALLFIGGELQSSDLSVYEQADSVLLDLLEISFARSNTSMAFPYVSASEDVSLEDLLVSGFTEACGDDLGIGNIASLGSCSRDNTNHEQTGALHSVQDYLTKRKEESHSGKTDLVMFCNGHSQALKNVDRTQSEGEVLSELIRSVEESGAKYAVLYVSDPSRSPKYPSYRELQRFLAESTNGNESSNATICNPVCQLASSLLEGLIVGIVLLIILISGLCCMMGIDTPTRFETPQES
uniref:V-type proton ATPase subunit S1/VOA1 transmembrane domain-containing protein n=1 Tax=Lotus japonicus TaxID=34305 RepID=I3T017_LOTJA|nr:unknown [Lotus japonicus]